MLVAFRADDHVLGTDESWYFPWSWISELVQTKDSYRSWEFEFPVLVVKTPLKEQNRHMKYDKHLVRLVERWQIQSSCVGLSQLKGLANDPPETTEAAGRTPASRKMKLKIFPDHSSYYRF